MLKILYNARVCREWLSVNTIVKYKGVYNYCYFLPHVSFDFTSTPLGVHLNERLI